MAGTGFSNSMFVAELRYIQSIRERREFRNPDAWVKRFIPTLRRWRCAWLSPYKLADLRADPFYYYLLARTEYYDRVFLDAIGDNVRFIVNVGCGTDTRPYRFKDVLEQKGIKVLECDQPAAIEQKAELIRRQGIFDHVAYMSLNLNSAVWPELETWLSRNRAGKGLVFMEGVSPYVNSDTFNRFLSLLARELLPGSRVAYDFKLSGVNDDFGRIGQTQRPFRLPAVRKEVADYHKKLGYRLQHMELSSELSIRLLPGQGQSGAPLFTEDALLQLEL
jgi:methyltransferase (TIGR00027 family)